MCGIYGFAGFQEDGLLEKMSHVLRHRGPGGASRYLGSDAIALSMGVRQRVLMEPGSAHPFFFQDQTVSVVLDGVISNKNELTVRLIAQGHLVKDEGDAALVACGFLAWGLDDLLKQLNGSFVFAVYDARHREVLLARDQSGQKPLYHTQVGGRFLFASEIKALLQSAHVEARPDTKAIDPYLTLGYVPEPKTLFAGIYALPAAHYLRHRVGGETTVVRYWDISLLSSESGRPLKDDEYQAQFATLWNEVTRSALTQSHGGLLGAVLDGELPSALVASAMLEQQVGSKTYSVSFATDVVDKSPAAEMARLLGTSHQEVIVSAEDFCLLPLVAWHLDRPLGDGRHIFFYKMAQAAALEVPSLASSVGADEGLGARAYHRALALAETYRRMAPKVLRRGIALPGVNLAPWTVARLFAKLPASSGRQGKKRFVDFLKNQDSRDPVHNANVLRALWAQDERRHVYADEFKSLASEAWMGADKTTDATSSYLDRVLQHQYHDALPSGTLAPLDQAAMAHHMGQSLPFLDRRLIEFFFTLPTHLKFHRWSDSTLIRNLAKHHLPKRFDRAAGHPTTFPASYYFEHPEFKTLVADTLDPVQVKKRGYFNPRHVGALVQSMESTRDPATCRQVMSLVTLEFWHRVFVDKQYAFES